MSEEIAGRLLARLADGEPQSGAELCAALGLDAARLDEQIDLLTAVGCVIECAAGPTPAEGTLRWRQPVALLDAQRIAASARDVATVHSRVIVGSTNALLLGGALEGYPTPAALLAEAQSAGRGRSGRRWLSPFGHNLYMSVAFDWPRPVAALGGLSLAVGIAAAAALHAWCGAPIKVKWPNDVLHDGAKLAGILIETTRIRAGRTRVVVGMGTNVNATSLSADGPGQPWTSLARITGATQDRNELAVSLLDALAGAFTTFERDGLAPFQRQWHQYDAFAGQPVRASGAGGALVGVASGIDAGGRLLVETGSGTIPVDAGEVSLRPAGEDV